MIIIKTAAGITRFVSIFLKGNFFIFINELYTNKKQAQVQKSKAFADVSRVQGGGFLEKSPPGLAAVGKIIVIF
jgi:hypothetical protein